MPAELDVAAYLATKGYRGKQGPGPELIYPCFFDCQEPADSRKRKLYVNTEEGVYQCKVCLAEGGTYLLQQHFGDDPKASVSSDDSFARRKILNWASEVGATMLENHDPAMLYLVNDRGLDPETVINARLGCITNGWSLTGSLPEAFTRDQLKHTGLVHRDGPRAGEDFFYHHLLIPYFSHGSVVQIRGRALESGARMKYATGPGDSPRIYRSDDLDTCDEVIITEGEFDALILKQHLSAATENRVTTIGVVGLAGTGAWPENIDSYFTHVKRVFIGFDSDAPGKRAAEKLAEKLGPKARILVLPEEGGRKCDWTEYLLPVTENATDMWRAEHPYAGHTWRDVLRLLGAASGKRVFSISEAGLAYREYRQTHSGLKTGYTQIDATILPGLLPGQLWVYLAKTGSGKGHVLTEEIPTPQGWRRWGDLAIGDEVFGRDGAPTTVTAVYDRGVLPTYRVTFSDHSSMVVDGDHLWQVTDHQGRSRHPKEATKTTTELIAAGVRGHGREFRWSIPIAQPLQRPHADLSIEPYTVGALLANGCLVNNSAVLTTPDGQVIDRIRQHYELPWKERSEGLCRRGVVKGVIGPARALGMHVKSRHKRIPTPYLQASIDQRIALLQGLMDGDGSSRSKQGRSAVRYHTTSPGLAQDVRELVTSLAGTAIIYRADRGQKGVEFTVGIMLPREINPFSTSRKQRGKTVYRRRVPRRVITSITPEGPQRIRCISVSAHDQLYVVGRDHIVTHNTLFLCNLAVNMRARKQLIVSLEMTREEVYDRLRRIYLFTHPEENDDAVEDALSNIYICDENRITEAGLDTLLDEFEVESGDKPDVVFVDYLGYYARGAKGNGQYEKVTNAVMSLKAVAKSNRCTIIVPAQVNRLAKEGKPIDIDDARDSGAIEETADFLMALYRPDDAMTVDGAATNVQPSGRVKCTVLKSRHGGKGRTFTFIMDLITLAIVEDGTPAAKRVVEHNYLSWRGHTWDDLRREELRPRQLDFTGKAH